MKRVKHPDKSSRESNTIKIVVKVAITLEKVQKEVP